MSARKCVYCAGNGCEECDGTGKRYREHLVTPEGIRFSVSGSGALTDEAREALYDLVRAAADKMALLGR
jgi:hypothetical protein